MNFFFLKDWAKNVGCHNPGEKGLQPGQGGGSWMNVKWSDPDFVSKLELMGFADVLDMGCEKIQETRMTEAYGLSCWKVVLLVAEFGKAEVRRKFGEVNQEFWIETIYSHLEAS